MFCHVLSAALGFSVICSVAENNVNNIPPQETNKKKSSFNLFDLGALHSTLDIWDRCTKEEKKKGRSLFENLRQCPHFKSYTTVIDSNATTVTFTQAKP